MRGCQTSVFKKPISFIRVSQCLVGVIHQMTTRQEQQKENWRHSGSAFTVSTVFFLIRWRFCCAAVGSVSSQAGIMSCELSRLEQAFPLPPGSPAVLPGRGGAGKGPHACLHLFLLAEPRSQQCRPQPFSAPISHLSRSRGEASLYPRRSCQSKSGRAGLEVTPLCQGGSVSAALTAAAAAAAAGAMLVGDGSRLAYVAS